MKEITSEKLSGNLLSCFLVFVLFPLDAFKALHVDPIIVLLEIPEPHQAHWVI